MKIGLKLLDENFHKTITEISSDKCVECSDLVSGIMLLPLFSHG